MKILKKVSLKPYTSFHIGGQAELFCHIADEFDAREAYELARAKKLPVLLLGGGSNMLVSDSGFSGVAALVRNSGIEILKETATSVLLRVAAGEVWDQVVEFAVKSGWWGMENLSHIPGRTAGMAVQNAGAYGQEAADIVDSVQVFDTQDFSIKSIAARDCEFAYRSSIFNRRQKGRYLIFSVDFRLSKKPRPCLEYADLKKYFTGAEPKLGDIRRAIIEIRDKKFPFPTSAKTGNAGSFFKNLLLSSIEFKDLKKRFVSVLGQAASVTLEEKTVLQDGKYKVPTAYLMQAAGLKGAQVGGAKINPAQPLVVLNATGRATAADVLKLASAARKELKQKFGVVPDIEPELVGFSAKELRILES